MSTGVTLQKLVAESTAAGPELFPTSWALQKLRLPNADSRIQTLTTPNGSELVFVEYKPFEKEPSTVVRERMKRLAKLLSLPKAAESGFNTLRCIGVVRQDSPAKRFVFIFKMPTEVPGPPLSIDNVPIDLAGAVASSTIRRPTLGQKFKLAGVLAETVFQLHSVNWLHKSIRSENVLLPRHSTVIEYSKPYLVGFEFSRDENDRSTTEHDDILARNIYRHPDRHGPPEERFTVLHDIYALGVTLLEIGLWRPILGFDKNFGQKTPAEIKLCLESHARERLPHYMGTGYTTAVLHCLQGTLINTGQSSNALGVTWGDSQREQVQIALLETVIKGIDSGKIPD
jgi:serine/threonine protein kinase